MPASSFADTIISKLKSSIGTDGSKYNSGTPAIANQAIALGITEYLMSNTTISVAYVGTTTTVPPSPFSTTDSCKITGTCAPPSGTDFNTWIQSIASNIVAGFFIMPGAMVLPISPPPAFIPGLVISQSSLKSEHENNLDDPQKPVWTVICQAILDWLNKIVSPPYAASTASPPSMGTATITKISVS